MSKLDTKLAMADVVVKSGREWTMKMVESMEGDIVELIQGMFKDVSDLSAEEEQELLNELVNDYMEFMRRGLNRAHKSMKKALEESE